MSLVSPLAHDSMRVVPRAANCSSEALKKFSSKRRYVLTIAILRPTVFSHAVIADSRPDSVRCSGRTHAPRYEPCVGGAMGPAANGPVEVAMAGGAPGAPGGAWVPVGDGRGAGVSFVDITLRVTAVAPATTATTTAATSPIRFTA